MDGTVTIGLDLETKGFDLEIKATKDKLEALEEEYQILSKAKPFEGQEMQLIKIKEEAEKYRNKLVELNRKQQQLNQQEVFKGVDISLGKIIKKVTQWGLALFGLRSIYGFLQNATTRIASNDKQLNADIEYMKNALAYSLEPIIRVLVNLAQQFLTYIAYIIKSWTGYNIFENANKSLKNANKSATKLKNTLASFDELNILQDNREEGVTSPSFDLSNINNVKVPDWIKWIADNKDVILTVLGALATTFAWSKVSKWISNLAGLRSALGYGGGVLGLLNSIATFGAITLTIYMAHKIIEDTKQLKKDIVEIADTNAEAGKKQIEQIEDIGVLLEGNNNLVYSGYGTIKDINSVFWNIFNVGKENTNTLKRNLELTNGQLEKAYEIYKTNGATEEVQEDLLYNIGMQIEYNKKAIETLKKQGEDTSALEEKNKTLAGYANDIYQSLNNTNDELYDIEQLTINDKSFDIKIKADTTEAEKSLSSLERTLNSLYKETTIAKITGTSTPQELGKKTTIYQLWKHYFGAKGMIYTPPKLAVGGIINQPGRGVPIGSAIGGERGAEGVIPLTDSQQMALLGEAIGRYITVNANIVNTMNGRVISRELKKVQNEDSFATNR